MSAGCCTSRSPRRTRRRVSAPSSRSARPTSTAHSPRPTGENPHMPLFGKGDGEGAPVGRVLVATDRSETAERAGAFAADLAERYGAELVLLQVRKPGSPPDPDAEDDLQRHAESLAGARGR